MISVADFLCGSLAVYALFSSLYYIVYIIAYFYFGINFSLFLSVIFFPGAFAFFSAVITGILQGLSEKLDKIANTNL